ncbi:MAG: multicopper oxidase domain-containing protein [Alphaproteobacteria bacterium]|nr:multicopper oxidase domain-containing protein [Alphaproteobacteria bacterium]
MANIDAWLQLENNKWDTAPHHIDRMSGQSIAAAEGKGPFTGITLSSPVSGAMRPSLTMYLPMLDASGNPIDSLLFRRYTAGWAAPDDHKVNAWDLNELNPTDTGTMGTIPGPVIECNVGDTVTVHFRNMDNRVGKDVVARAHSIHVHGFVFSNAHDGAYPLSPSDPAQPVGAEAALWSMVGVTGNKRGDRVPPGGTFEYTWKTLGWPTTSGVWLYHDHSVCDMENIDLGAIGIVVIHDPNDANDVVMAATDLPGGSFTGSPLVRRCTPFPVRVPALPYDLIPDLHNFAPTGLGTLRGKAAPVATTPVATAHAPPAPGMLAAEEPGAAMRTGHATAMRMADTRQVDMEAELQANAALLVQRGDFQLQLADDFSHIIGICHSNFRPPRRRRCSSSSSSIARMARC